MIKRTLEQAQELDLIMQRAKKDNGIIMPGSINKQTSDYRIYKLAQTIEYETGYLKQLPNSNTFMYMGKSYHAMEISNDKPFEKMYYDDLAETERRMIIEREKTFREWLTIYISGFAIVISIVALVLQFIYNKSN